MERGNIGERGRIARTLAAGAFLGATVLNACAVPLPDPSPEATPRGSITVCYENDPTCAKPLAVVRQGNSTPVKTIPDMCVDGIMVKEDKKTEVDPDLLWAVLANEDREFCTTKGANIMALLKAGFDTLTGEPRGGSGIPQQVARIYYVNDVPDNLIARKFWESFEISPTLDSEYAKTEIMRIYVNSAYWGDGKYGIKEASNMYFGVDPDNLTIPQTAFLAGILDAPDVYSPKKDPAADLIAAQKGIEKRNEALQNEVEFGRLTQAQADKYKAEPLGRLPYKPNDNISSDYAEADRVNAHGAIHEIIGQVMKVTGLSWDELMDRNVRIRSTIVEEDQAALANAVASNPLPAGGPQFGAMFIDDTGAVTGYIPGVYEKNGANVNILKAPALSGSFHKILITIELLKRGYTPDSPMPNPPTLEWPNYDGNGRNYTISESNHCPEVECTLRIALSKSVNVAFVGEVMKLEQSGDHIMTDTIHDMETLDMDPGPLVGPSIVLGGQQVSPERNAMMLQKVGSRQGQDSEMRFVDGYTLDNGETGTYVPPTFAQLFDPALTAELTDLMRGVITGGTMHSAFAGIVGETDIAGKSLTAAHNDNAGAGVFFCDASGRNKAIFVDERYAKSLASMGPDTDGGGPPARVAAAAIKPLIGEWCSITDANKLRVASGR